MLAEYSRGVYEVTVCCRQIVFCFGSIVRVGGSGYLSAGVIGTGLTGTDYLNPLFWLTIPRLIPFAASILAAWIGLIYWGVEKNFKRPANFLLTVVHLVSFVLAILGYATLAHFWWTVLNEENATNTPMPFSASLVMLAASTVSLLAFGVNIFWSMSRTPLVTSKPR
ncbi:MAG TPA: hypothetical protein VIH88_14985 [Candidatus Acidoferrales bacterium]